MPESDYDRPAGSGEGGEVVADRMDARQTEIEGIHAKMLTDIASAETEMDKELAFWGGVSQLVDSGVALLQQWQTGQQAKATAAAAAPPKVDVRSTVMNALPSLFGAGGFNAGAATDLLKTFL